MLAMCVRKTGDTHSGVCPPMGAVQPTGTSSGSSSSRRKHKPFKVLKPRSSKEERKDRVKAEQREKEEVERIPSPIVQDDEDGHLIYRKGDLLDKRCETARNMCIHTIVYTCVQLCFPSCLFISSVGPFGQKVITSVPPIVVILHPFFLFCAFVYCPNMFY